MTPFLDILKITRDNYPDLADDEILASGHVNFSGLIMREAM